jgi:hypothetical protein
MTANNSSRRHDLAAHNATLTSVLTRLGAVEKQLSASLIEGERTKSDILLALQQSQGGGNGGK